MSEKDKDRGKGGGNLFWCLCGLADIPPRWEVENLGLPEGPSIAQHPPFPATI
jgi:hypothetical protein